MWAPCLTLFPRGSHACLSLDTASKSMYGDRRGNLLFPGLRSFFESGSFQQHATQLTWHQNSAAPDNTAARLAAGRRAISQCQQKADVARLALPGSVNERDELCNTAQMSNSQAQQQQQQWTRRTCANKRQLLADQSHTRVDSGLFCDGGHVERE